MAVSRNGKRLRQFVGMPVLITDPISAAEGSTGGEG